MIPDVPMTEALEPAVLERREHERVGVKLKVGFQVLSDEQAMKEVADFELNGQPVESHTEDLSLGGMKLLGDMSLLGSRRLEKGAFLRVEIEVPGKMSGIHAVGAVAWSRKSSDLRTFQAGISFIGLDPDDYQRLESFLKSRGMN